MKKILVVAPHPDDETLGCGGTLLRHKALGDEISWMVVTTISESMGFSRERVRTREQEIERVAQMYQFANVYQCSFPTTRLDSLPIGDIVSEFSAIFRELAPQIVYVPYRGDIHTDHAVVFDAVASCTKWFRYPSVQRVLAYETLSETDFLIDSDANGFRPNSFVDISAYLEKKVEIMNIFASEVGEFPFPRSDKAIRALAHVRGTAAGFEAAEAFMLLRERV